MASHLIKIESTPDLVEQVYRSLLDAISDGSMAPGARIMQEDIAAQLAVSRQPVLQALRLLKKDGFVLDAPGRGVLVAPLDVTGLAQIYQVRSALDALAARLAARGRSAIDPCLINQGRKATRGTNVKAMMAADEAFHAAIYAASGNPLIALSAQQHWHHIRRAMGAVLQVSTIRKSVWDEHAAIADAILQGDEDLAETLIRQHGEDAARNLASLLTSALTHLKTQGDALDASLPMGKEMRSLSGKSMNSRLSGREKKARASGVDPLMDTASKCPRRDRPRSSQTP